MNPDDKTSSSSCRRRLLLQALAGVALASGTGLAGRAMALTVEAHPQDVFDVVIIGAGLAGLTAARDLDRAGCASFAVLEARDRVGGRTYNHQLGNGIICEAGGQWVGPGQTAIWSICSSGSPITRTSIRPSTGPRGTHAPNRICQCGLTPDYRYPVCSKPDRADQPHVPLAPIPDFQSCRSSATAT